MLKANIINNQFFIIMATRKTILHLEVDKNEYNCQYTGSFEFSEDKKVRKHDERIMDALLSDEQLFRFFYRLVEPVRRCKMREARKAAKISNVKSQISNVK